jgi:hypothetical protein
MRSAYIILVGNPEKIRSVWTLVPGREDAVKINLNDTGICV